jgi:hypothetical protein
MEFNKKRADALFCSKICASSFRRKTKKEDIALYAKNYYIKNKERLDKKNSHNYFANKTVLEKQNCLHCGENFQPRRKDNKFCTLKCGCSFWRTHNKEYIKQDQELRYHNDINRKISSCLRSRLNKALKGNVKSARTIELFGCTVDELIKYIQSKFQPGMAWDNHMQTGWHIDHIIPLSSFDLSDPDQLKQACHYTNLQPLWASDNLKKGGVRG